MNRKGFFPAMALAAAISLPALPAQTPEAALEITLKLSTPGFPAAGFVTARPAAHRLAVRGRRPVAEAPQMERNPALAEDRVVIAAFDKDGRELARVILIDPRLLRAEVADEEGRLSSRLLYRPEVEFTVALPAHPGIAVLRVYQPVWDGRSFELFLLAEVELEGGR